MKTASRTFGIYKVSILHDGVLKPPSNVLVHPEGQRALEKALDGFDASELKMVVNCFLLEGPDEIILIDTGVGSFWGEGFGQARDALKAAGVNPQDVKKVIITHVHGDHVAGLFEAGTLYYPNAEVYVPDVDLNHFSDKAIMAATPEQRRGGFTMGDLLNTHYGPRLQRFQEGKLLDEIEIIQLPGHTPGHVGCLIGRDGDQLLILADGLHLAELQPRDPNISLVYDLDMDNAISSRKRALSRAADEGWVIAGSHLRGFSRVERKGEGFTLEPLA